MSAATRRDLNRAPSIPIVGFGAGIVLSLAAHASVVALLVALLHPRKIADQPIPKSEIRVETQVVQQSKAKALPAAGAKARADAAQGTLAAQGVVSFSQAKPVNPPETPARAAPAEGNLAATMAPPLTSVAPAAAAGEVLTQSAPPTVETASPLTPTSNATPVAAAALPSIAVTQSAPPTVTLLATTKATALPPAPAQGAIAPAAEPTQVSVAAVPASGRPASQPAPPPTVHPIAPTGQALPAASHDTTLAATSFAGKNVTPAQQQGESLAAASAVGQRMTATLAWRGSGGVVDPVSLKAVASFMRPQSAATRADGVHDGISSLLSSVPCARMQAEFNPETGSLDLRGHVPDPALKAPMVAALQAQVGSGIKVNDELMILPRPQCTALTGIADVGLPQSQDQLTNPRLIGPNTQVRTFSYVQGQTMVLDLTAPKYDAYIYVDYFDAGGNVIHLIPNDRVPLRLHKANSTLHVGADNPNVPHLSITVGPPYGQEIAVAFAASDPLYHGIRPLREPAGAYLAWLRKRVAAARAKDQNFKGEWVYFMVRTHAK